MSHEFAAPVHSQAFMDVVRPEIERPRFELRLVNAHVLEWKTYYERLPDEIARTRFLKLTAVCPPVLLGDSDEQRSIFKAFEAARKVHGDEKMRTTVMSANRDVGAPAYNVGREATEGAAVCSFWGAHGVLAGWWERAKMQGGL